MTDRNITNDRQCTRCGKTKPEIAFRIHSKGNRRSDCRDCEVQKQIARQRTRTSGLGASWPKRKRTVT